MTQEIERSFDIDETPSIHLSIASVFQRPTTSERIVDESTRDVRRTRASGARIKKKKKKLVPRSSTSSVARRRTRASSARRIRSGRLQYRRHPSSPRHLSSSTRTDGRWRRDPRGGGGAWGESTGRDSSIWTPRRRKDLDISTYTRGRRSSRTDKVGDRSIELDRGDGWDRDRDGMWEGGWGWDVGWARAA